MNSLQNKENVKNLKPPILSRIPKIKEVIKEVEKDPLPLSCKENRFVSYLIKNKIANDWLGTIQSCYASVPLLHIDSSEQKNIEEFLKKPFPIIGHEGFDFEIEATTEEALLYIIESAQRIGLIVEDVVIVGSAVKRFLGISYFSRMFTSMKCALEGCFNQNELEQIQVELEKCSDYDIRLIFPKATVSQLSELSRSFLLFFLQKLQQKPLSLQKQKEGLEILEKKFPRQFEDFQMKAYSVESVHYFLIRTLVYEKFFCTDEQAKTQYAILGFGDRNAMRLECLVCAKLQAGKSYNSYHRSLTLSIKTLLPAVGAFQPKKQQLIIPTNEFQQGLQALADELSKIFRPSSIIDETYWMTMLVANLKGFCCNIPGKPKELFDCFLNQTKKEINQEEFICKQLEKCMHNHLGNSPIARVCLTWAAFSFLKNDLSNEKMQSVIEKMFSPLSHNDLGPVKPIVEIIKSPLSFNTKKSLLNIIAFITAYENNNKIHSVCNLDNEISIFQLYLQENPSSQYCMTFEVNVQESYQQITDLLKEKETSKESKALNKIINSLFSHLSPKNLLDETDHFLKPMIESLYEDWSFRSNLIKQMKSNHVNLQWLSTMFALCLPRIVQDEYSLDPVIKRFPRFIQRSLDAEAKNRWVNNIIYLLKIKCGEEQKDRLELMINEARKSIEENHKSALDLLEYWIILLAKTANCKLERLSFEIWENSNIEIESHKKIGRSFLQQLINNKSHFLAVSLFQVLWTGQPFASKCEELIWLCEIGSNTTPELTLTNNICRFAQELIDLKTVFSNTELPLSFSPLIQFLQKENQDIAHHFIQMIHKKNCVAKKTLSTIWLEFCQYLLEKKEVITCSTIWLEAKKENLWKYNEIDHTQEILLIDLLKSWPIPISMEQILLFNDLFADCKLSPSIEIVYTYIRNSFYQNLIEKKEGTLASTLQGVTEENKKKIELQIIEKQISGQTFQEASHNIIQFAKTKNLSDSQLIELRRLVLQFIEAIDGSIIFTHLKIFQNFLKTISPENSFTNGWQGWIEAVWKALIKAPLDSAESEVYLQIILDRIYSSQNEKFIDSDTHLQITEKIRQSLTKKSSTTQKSTLTVPTSSLIQVLYQQNCFDEIVSLLNDMDLYQQIQLDEKSLLCSLNTVQVLVTNTHNTMDKEEDLKGLQKLHQMMLLFDRQSKFMKDLPQEVLLDVYLKMISLMVEQDLMDWASLWSKKVVELEIKQKDNSSSSKLSYPLLKKLIQFYIENFQKAKTGGEQLELALNLLDMYAEKPVDLWQKLLETIADTDLIELKQKAWKKCVGSPSRLTNDSTLEFFDLFLTIWIETCPHEAKLWLLDENSLKPAWILENISEELTMHLSLRIFNHFKLEKALQSPIDKKILFKLCLIKNSLSPVKQLLFLSRMIEYKQKEWIAIAIEHLEALDLELPNELTLEKIELAEKVVPQLIDARDPSQKDLIRRLVEKTPWNNLLTQSSKEHLRIKFFLYSTELSTTIESKDWGTEKLKIFRNLFSIGLVKDDLFSVHFVECFWNFLLLYADQYSLSFEELQEYEKKIVQDEGIREDFVLASSADWELLSLKKAPCIKNEDNSKIQTVMSQVEREVFLRKIFIDQTINKVRSLYCLSYVEKQLFGISSSVEEDDYLLDLLRCLESEFLYLLSDKLPLDHSSREVLSQQFYNFIYLQLELGLEYPISIKVTHLLELASQSSLLKALNHSKICEIYFLTAADALLESSDGSLHKKYRLIFSDLKISNTDIRLGAFSTIKSLLVNPQEKFLKMAYQLTQCYHPILLEGNTQEFENIFNLLIQINQNNIMFSASFAFDTLKDLQKLMTALTNFYEKLVKSNSKTNYDKNSIRDLLFSISRKWMTLLHHFNKIEYKSEDSIDYIGMYRVALEYCIPLFCSQNKYPEFLEYLKMYCSIIIKDANRVCKSPTSDAETYHSKLGAYFRIAARTITSFLPQYPSKTVEEKKKFSYALKDMCIDIQNHWEGKLGLGLAEEFNNLLIQSY